MHCRQVGLETNLCSHCLCTNLHFLHLCMEQNLPPLQKSLKLKVSADVNPRTHPRKKNASLKPITILIYILLFHYFSERELYSRHSKSLPHNKLMLNKTTVLTFSISLQGKNIKS